MEGSVPRDGATHLSAVLALLTDTELRTLLRLVQHERAARARRDAAVEVPQEAVPDRGWHAP